MELNLLILPGVLKMRFAPHSNVDDKLLIPEIKAAQDVYLENILGTVLLDKILLDVKNNLLLGDYKFLMDKYIIDCLCNYVLSGLPDALNYQFWNKGIAAKNTTDSTLPNINELFHIINKYRNRAEDYGNKLTKYLQENKTKFPEYFANTNGTSFNENNENFNTSIYLG